MSENNNNSLGTIFTFLLGGLIGAGIALLYAPASGEVTRKRLRKEVDKRGEDLKQRYESVVDTVEEGMGKVKEIIEDKKNEVVAAYQSGKDAFHREKSKHT